MAKRIPILFPKGNKHDTHHTRSGENDVEVVPLFQNIATGTVYGYQRRRRSYGTVIVPVLRRSRDAEWIDITNGRVEDPTRDWIEFMKQWLTATYVPSEEDVVWLKPTENLENSSEITFS